MAFGPIMKFRVDDLRIKLAPVTKEALPAFVEGMQKASVIQYISFHAAQIIEDEEQWFNQIIKEKDGLVWGIWVEGGDGDKLIGNTSLSNIRQKHTIYAESGCVLTDKDYWGRGIISAAHMARTWYAFNQYGMMRIKSSVLQCNHASRRTLEKSGYYITHIERNAQFMNGKLEHLDWLECLNPDDWAWRQWWGDDRPTKKAIEARAVTKKAMSWAEKNVKLL